MLPALHHLLLAAAAVGFDARAAGAAAAATTAPEDDILWPRALDTRDTLSAFDAQVGEGFIRFPVHATRSSGSSDDDGDSGSSSDKRSLREMLLRARQTSEVSLTNLQDGTIYTIELGIGTPAQPVEVIIDTGSSELWVNPDCTTSSSRRLCQSFPRYSTSLSRTVRNAGATGFIQYGKGNVTLRYVSDNVSVGSSATIQGQIFGVATASNDIPMGIMGLAPKLSSRAANYSYLLDSLATQNLIRSRAFSLDLRSVDNPNGAVIFGGVDTTKFIGSLAKLPIIPAGETPRRADRYYVYMTSLSVTPANGASTNAFASPSTAAGEPVFLDSGGTLSRLPEAMFDAIGKAFPTAEYDRQSGFYMVDCSVADSAGTVDFGFGNKTIRVSFADFIWRASASACVLGVLPEEEGGEPVLGASFLRAAYVVYDQDNRNLHLAQAANCGSGSAGIVAIGSGTAAVPSSTGRCTATPGATAHPTATAGGGGEGCTNCDGMVTVTVQPTATPTGSGGSGAGRANVSLSLVAASCLALLLAWCS